MALPGARLNDFKTVIRAVLTRWTMHYQSYRRLRELQSSIALVIEVDEKRPERQRLVITGDSRVKSKAREMVMLIKDQHFWHALAVYVAIEKFVVIGCSMFNCHPQDGTSSGTTCYRRKRHSSSRLPLGHCPLDLWVSCGAVSRNAA